MGNSVYFFGTCVGDMVYSEMAKNAIRLLTHAGVSVVYPKEQSCCGQPWYNSGFLDETRKVALAQVNAFSKHDYPIIIPSGSCGAMLKYDYLELFEGRPEFDRIKQFSDRVFELSDYLVNHLKVSYTDKGNAGKVTWHSSCHALRVMKSIDSSKALLSQMKNLEYVQLDNETICCGFGGTFAVKETDISGAMVTEKVDGIVRSGVDYIVSADAGCLLNISTAMQKRGITNIKAVHLFDLIADRAL